MMSPRRYGSPDATRLQAGDIYDGLLLVDKPAGPTSHDIVAHIRRQFQFDKVGHGGTLDPQATGLLVILIGRGTKLSSTVMNSDKVYEGYLRLGITTDSQDASGAVLSERDPGAVTREALEDEISKYSGDIMQTPPMVSAIKMQGRALYKLARKGKTVEREPRLIHIYEFKLIEFDSPRASFRLNCSKGTYVRTICNDIGETLGCGAVLDELRRTRAGNWSIQDALTLPAIKAMDREQLLEHIIPVHKVTKANNPDA